MRWLVPHAQTLPHALGAIVHLESYLYFQLIVPLESAGTEKHPSELGSVLYAHRKLL
jgi:hypothetical protein